MLSLWFKGPWDPIVPSRGGSGTGSSLTSAALVLGTRKRNGEVAERDKGGMDVVVR